MSLRRTGPPQRKTELARTGGLARGRMNQQSEKRKRQQKVRRALAAPLEGEACWLRLDVCTGRAEHWHELVAAKQGGSRTDPRNICAACDTCNSELENRPDRYERGWKVRQEDAVRGVGGLVPAVASPLSLASRLAKGDAA